MSHIAMCDAIMMFKTGKFSIKEVAAKVGIYEWQFADYLINVGALRRRP